MTELRSACEKAVKNMIEGLTGEEPTEEQIQNYIDHTDYCEEYVKNYEESVEESASAMSS